MIDVVRSSLAFAFFFILTISDLSAENHHPLDELLNKIRQANFVGLRIKDDWNGLSHLAPSRRRYYFIKDVGILHGFGTLSVGHGDRNRMEVVKDLRIPIDKIKTSLAYLQNIELKEGKYQPREDHTDDYPDLAIIFDGGDRELQLYSASPG